MKDLLSIHKVVFGIVSRCQLKCIGCPGALHKGALKHISVDDFRQCLANINTLHVDTFKLYNCSSESLLHPALPQIIEFIPRQGWTVKNIHLTTNGQTFTREQLEDIIKLKIVTRLAISCDGDGTPESYKKLRPPSKWEKLIEFLDITKELIDKYDPKLSFIAQTICQDKKDMNRWTTMMDKYGVKVEFRKWSRLPEYNKLAPHGKLAKNGVCLYAQSTKIRIFVDYRGDVHPCCAHPNAANYGSLIENRLKHIYYGENRRKFIKLLAKKRHKMAICGDCGEG